MDHGIYIKVGMKVPNMTLQLVINTTQSTCNRVWVVKLLTHLPCLLVRSLSVWVVSQHHCSKKLALLQPDMTSMACSILSNFWQTCQIYMTCGERMGDEWLPWEGDGVGGEGLVKWDLFHLVLNYWFLDLMENTEECILVQSSVFSTSVLGFEYLTLVNRSTCELFLPLLCIILLFT